MNGLIDRDFYYIRKALGSFPEIESVKLFGSRALGNHKKGSDVDLAIVGEKVSNSTMVRLNEYLNEIYPLPYMFDLVDYNSLSNANLKHHIDTIGQDLYRKPVS